MERQILDEIVHPTLKGAAADGFPFRGVLYVGLMLTRAGARVLEYNVRLGDPETQAILRRLDTPFAEIAASVASGKLSSVAPKWSDEAATCVVIASENYPAGSSSGLPISGLEAADAVKGVVVFHAGSRRGKGGSIETAGGRILGVTARAPTLEEAAQQAYQAVDQITFEGMRYRRDIGKR
jgi:phosphoribosylamine--glycine ligase